MPLTERPSLRTTIAAMTAVLLGPGVVRGAEQTRIESEVLRYSESGRVTATEAVASVKRPLGPVYTLGLKLTYDGMTGASPIGAVPSSKVQTFTRPSGRSANVIQPGAIPMDGSFNDHRVAFDADLSRIVGRLTTVSFGSHVSLEHDYSSLGLNGSVTRDFNRKNTTIGLSVSLSHDVTSPVGGYHTPFSSMPPPSSQRRRSGSGESKEILDLVAGFSQILDQKTIFRANYSFDRARGYLNDPYLILSVVSPPDSADAGDAVSYVYENRPVSRNKNAVYGELLKYLFGASVDVSFRHFWDDWGIRSNTVDGSVQFHTSRKIGIQPHLRYYHQSAARFYHPFLVEGVADPQFASADSRLASFDALTYGIRLSIPVRAASQFTISAEYYRQHGDSSPPEAFGSLRSYNLFPAIKALMLRLGYSHDL